MAKFELSINAKYLPEWGVWEGVRELIQNGKDAEVEHSAPLTVDWKNGVLRIENEGVVMPREALLFGTTSKGGRADLIGKFGEGLKLGVLALVRAGRSVKMRSGSEVWNPTIARSEKLNADVLVFDIKDGNEDKKRVRIEIGGVIESEWQDFRTRFLFLADKRYSDKETIATNEGTLLTHERHKGKVFNKGIFVMHEPKLQYGYDLPDIELDRDRKMVNHTALARTSAEVWHAALKQRPDLFDTYFDMVTSMESIMDVCEVDYYTHPDYDIVDKMAERFIKRYGEKSVPVLSTAESADIEHFGVRGIVVSSQMNGILRNTTKVQQAGALKEKMKFEVTKICGVNDLTQHELANFEAAKELLWTANETWTNQDGLFSRIDVVEFRSPTLQGLHKADRVLMARKTLATVEDALEVLVHEFAHDNGRDGDKSHVATIEKYWRNITSKLRLQLHLKGGK